VDTARRAFLYCRRMWCPRCNRTWGDDFRFCSQDGARLLESTQVEELPAIPSVQSGVLLGARYQVRGYIGKGAMARVYLAQDLETQEPVAVKVLNDLYARDAAARERFLHEARAASGIRHQNIVRILDTGERGDGAPYLVMEYLFGESLGDYLRREKKVPLSLALPILCRTASALAAAHAAGIVHRDVKPDNLFLLGEPGDPHDVKLLDFGFAKLHMSNMTAAGMALGTPDYMAPEQALSDRVDARTDIYALGAVMYRMLTGELPFGGDDDAELIATVVLCPILPPTTHDPALDPRLNAIVMTAMRKRPDNRYATMREMKADLEVVRAGDGGVLATEKAVQEPDVYEPVSLIAQGAMAYFKRLLRVS
jgi:eukaryotic-like serine/threonine-protein kinase